MNFDRITDKPVLNDPDDIYYEGCGCEWDKDLNGDYYWKLYHPAKIVLPVDNYRHLQIDDIVNERARIEKIVEKKVSRMLGFKIGKQLKDENI